MPQLEINLVLVVACLTHLSAQGLLDCLATMPAPEGCGEPTAFAFVMATWCGWQSDIQVGDYKQINGHIRGLFCVARASMNILTY